MSAGLADRHGRVVAQGRDIPAQLGALPSSLDAMLADWHGRLRPGDALIGNDPYLCGSNHVNDVCLILPAFAGGRPARLRVHPHALDGHRRRHARLVQRARERHVRRGPADPDAAGLPRLRAGGRHLGADLHQRARPRRARVGPARGLRRVRDGRARAQAAGLPLRRGDADRRDGGVDRLHGAARAVPDRRGARRHLRRRGLARGRRLDQRPDPRAGRDHDLGRRDPDGLGRHRSPGPRRREPPAVVDRRRRHLRAQGGAGARHPGQRGDVGAAHGEGARRAHW